MNNFCDGVLAALITVLVLDLPPPELPTFYALLTRPTWLSYAVSYVFIAIVGDRFGRARSGGLLVIGVPLLFRRR